MSIWCLLLRCLHKIDLSIHSGYLLPESHQTCVPGTNNYYFPDVLKVRRERQDLRMDANNCEICN
ncbi:hypothetical protein H5410_033559, partial [Solanum commersonii]